MTAQARASVLVVDDEPGMRDMLAYELSQEGFYVQTADSGASAVEAMKRRKFDLAITDLKMPGMDGVEVVEVLREIDPDVEVIVATGYATVETAVACMKRGAYDYIQKPYDLEQLGLLLERALEKSHLQGIVALYEASRALLVTLQPGELTRLVVDLACRVLRADAVELILDDPPEEPVAKKTTSETPLELLQTLVGASMSEGGPARIPTPTHDWPTTTPPSRFGSALVCPLFTRERRIGHLVVLRSSGRPEFSDSELRRGAILAGQIALSLDNARLHDELTRKIDELIETRDHLIHAEKLGTAAQLAACVAHEINNPLTFLEANLDALRDYSTTVGRLWLAAKKSASYLRSIGDPQAHDLANALMTANQRGGDDTERRISDITEMVDDILHGVKRIAELVADFNGMTEPLSAAAPDDVDLTRLVAECADTSALSRVLDDVERPLVLELADGCRAWASVTNVRTALLNVLTFLGEQRKTRDASQAPLVARCVTENGQAVMEMIDPDLHMSDERRLRILDPRVAVDSRGGRALRLDLSMCLAYQLIRRNGGNLSVTSSMSHGTTFRIVLPMRA